MDSGVAVVREAEVLEVALPLLRAFVTGFGTTKTRRVVLVHLTDEDGNEGWGEAAPLDHPFYLPETTSGAFAVTSEWALPMALAVGPEPGAVARSLSSIRGNTFARAGVEAAFWCLKAARFGCSLAELFAGASAGAVAGADADAVLAGRPDRRAPSRGRVAVGESIGIHPSIDETVKEAELRHNDGYRRIKLKISPGWDVEVVRAVREALPAAAMLQVDANGSYGDSAADRAALRALDAFGLACIEQPLGWDDLLGHAELQASLDTAICLDESLRSPADVRRALRLGACRSVNLKPGRVGGVAASVEIHDLCADEGVPLFCGGMLESGIGRAVNLALCSLPGFTEPADMSPAALLYAWDLVEPSYEVSPEGTIAVPEAAGLGFSVRLDRLAAQVLRRVNVSTASPVS